MSICIDVRLHGKDFALDAKFTAPASGITAVFGRSGAGKSMLLRTIAGLEPASGTITLDDKTWLAPDQNVATHDRELGYVFQESSLFEHHSVQGNLEYGYRRINPGERRITFDQVTSVLKLGGLLDRQPATLSGGERQRVAIGRALLSSPRLLLLDEPLASLDIRHKREIMPFLESMCAEFKIPAIYVSHAPDEIARLADHLVLLDAGKVTAAGPVNEILTRFDLPLAFDTDAGTVIETTVGNHETDFNLTRLNFAGGHLLVPGQHATGRVLRVRVLARDVSLTLEKNDNTSILNILPATVTDISSAEDGQSLIKLDVSGNPLLARITQRSVEQLQLQAGKQLFAQIKTVALLS